MFSIPLSHRTAVFGFLLVASCASTTEPATTTPSTPPAPTSPEPIPPAACVPEQSFDAGPSAEPLGLVATDRAAYLLVRKAAGGLVVFRDNGAPVELAQGYKGRAAITLGPAGPCVLYRDTTASAKYVCGDSFDKVVGTIALPPRFHVNGDWTNVAIAEGADAAIGMVDTPSGNFRITKNGTSFAATEYPYELGSTPFSAGLYGGKPVVVTTGRSGSNVRENIYFDFGEVPTKLAVQPTPEYLDSVSVAFGKDRIHIAVTGVFVLSDAPRSAQFIDYDPSTNSSTVAPFAGAKAETLALSIDAKARLLAIYTEKARDGKERTLLSTAEWVPSLEPEWTTARTLEAGRASSTFATTTPAGLSVYAWSLGGKVELRRECQ